MTLDGETFGNEIVLTVKGYMSRVTEPLIARIAELESRSVGMTPEQEEVIFKTLVARIPAPDHAVIKAMIADAVAEIPAAKDGENVDPEDVRRMVAEAVAAIPPAKDGENVAPETVRAMVADAIAEIPTPRDGKSVDPEEIRQMVEAAVAALPPAEPGKDADPVLIKTMVSEAVAGLPQPDVTAMIEDATKRYVEQIPPPQDGKSVSIEEVREIISGELAQAVKAIPPAKDGIGLAGALIDRTGALVVTLTDGSTRDLGPVVGDDADQAAIEKQIASLVDAIPRPKDALGFDDLTVTYDGEREFVVRFAQGERVKEFPFKMPVVLDRGVFRAEKEYETGDAVTWGGSLWIAQRDTAAKPGDGDEWRLSVKKGRDAKPA